MLQTVLDKIYSNDVYLNYLRYNPRWYVTLNENPASINDFEKEVKINLKMTTSDKIENLRKQIDFINGMMTSASERVFRKRNYKGVMLLMLKYLGK